MISIITPLYRAENYVEQTIETVLHQTYTDWELILVDDCSPDESGNIADAMIRRLKEAGDIPEGKIRLIRKPVNEGAARARNTGIEDAKGRYIAFLDADDLWYPEKLEKELAFLQEKNAGFVYTSYQFGDEAARPTGKTVRVKDTLQFGQALTRTIIFTSTVLFDTEKVPKNLIHMPNIASEDTATWWTILKSGVTAYGLDELLVIYRRPSSSLSANKGKAIVRIFRLYREIAGLGIVPSCFYMIGWAWNATVRRVFPDASDCRAGRS